MIDHFLLDQRVEYFLKIALLLQQTKIFMRRRQRNF